MTTEVVQTVDTIKVTQSVHVVVRTPVRRNIEQLTFEQELGEDYVETAARAVKHVKEQKLELLEILSSRRTEVNVKEEHDALVEQTLKVL